MLQTLYSLAQQKRSGPDLQQPVDTEQHHCCGCRYGGGVDRRHAAVARGLADVMHSHSGTKVFVEQEAPALTRVVHGQREHARGSCLQPQRLCHILGHPSLVSAASTRPGHTAKRAEKTKLDRYPHINLVPFIFETTGLPHARKFISNLMRDADNPPLAIRDTW